MSELVDDSDDGLLEGWEWTTLDAITANHDGTRIPIKADDRKSRQGSYPYYGASGIIDTIDDYLFDGAFVLIGEDGANLVARSTPIAFQAHGKFWVNNHAHVLQTRGGIPLEFVEGFVNSIDLQPYVTGSAQPKLTQRNLNRIRVPLPPLREQKRIVAKVEALLERVNKARERLAKVPDILSQFRQSVLAAACTGHLTADWREENPDCEASEEYLRRVLGAGAIADVPSDVDPVALPDIPETWSWSRCGEICDASRAITYGVIKLGPPVDGGVPTLRSSDVRWLRIDDSHIKTISDDIAANYSRTFLKGGEILVTVRGTLGGVAVVPQNMAGFNISREVAMLPVVSELEAGFIALAIASVTCQSWLSEVKKGVAYTGVNIRDLKLLPIAIPPIGEQQEIVRRVDALFKLADRVEQRLTVATTQTERITQSVLAKAFAGELVETEADLARREGRDYEPASVLLERIAAERASAGNGKANTRTHRSTGTKTAKTKKTAR